MEIMTVVGIRRIDFTDDSGKRINGYSIYYTMEADGVVGLTAGKLYLPAEKAANMVIPQPGEKVEVMYDRYGKPVKFTVVG